MPWDDRSNVATDSVPVSQAFGFRIRVRRGNSNDDSLSRADAASALPESVGYSYTMRLGYNFHFTGTNSSAIQQSVAIGSDNPVQEHGASFSTVGSHARATNESAPLRLARRVNVAIIFVDSNSYHRVSELLSIVAGSTGNAHILEVRESFTFDTVKKAHCRA